MYIFVSSIGRSGTKFLSEVFKNCTDIPSYHSIEPHCIGDCQTRYNQGYRARDSHEIQEKIKQIQKLADKGGNLFESSHIFLRCYATPALAKLDPPIYVIHLTRDPLETARSYVNRGSYPNANDKPWRLRMNLRRNLLYLSEKNDLSPIQRNLSDWLENELRYWNLKSKFTDTYDFYFSDINNIDIWIEMFEKFDIKYDFEKLKNFIGDTDQDLVDVMNKNSKPTNVTDTDLAQSRELIKILKRNIVDLSPFNNSYYSKYQFIRELLAEPDVELRVPPRNN
tara:strand:- start:5617 stop:6459 length:843 start_codon:yes stop_codon:yes gene_type:complete